MDPNYVDEEEEAAAMAAMMGFSGFGSHKPPAKKRKFATDAFIDTQQESNLPIDKGGKKGQGSGGNTMPLGKTRVFGTGSSSNTIPLVAVNDSEIALDDDEELDGPQYVDTSLPPPVLAGEDDPQRPYFEPPSGVSDEEAKEMQSRIDAILTSVGSNEPPPSDTQPLRPYGLPQRPNFNPPKTMHDPGFMHGGPRDAFSDSASVATPRPTHRGGPKNEKWYLDYYDPSFNENPWASLEKEIGLEPLGKWPKIQRPR